MSFREGIRKNVVARAKEDLTWTDITGRILGNLIGSALDWAARTSIVVLTLKAWGVL